MRRANLVARSAMALTLLASTGACAITRGPTDRVTRDEECQFVVVNRTALALKIRQFRGYSTIPIGVINPGELLNESTSCSEGRVDVAGVPVPRQVGSAVHFAFVHGAADLIPRGRANVSLYWP